MIDVVKIVLSQPVAWPIAAAILVGSVGYTLGKLAAVIEAWRRPF